MLFGGSEMASFHSSFGDAQHGVTIIDREPDAKGIAGIDEPVNGGRAMHRRGGAKLSCEPAGRLSAQSAGGFRACGGLLAMSPFHGIPVLTPAEFLERLTGR